MSSCNCKCCRMSLTGVFGVMVLPYSLSVGVATGPSGCPNCTHRGSKILSQPLPSLFDVSVVTLISRLLVSVRSGMGFCG